MPVGMPVFTEVGLVLMMPIVAAAARRSDRPAILVGLSLLAGLSIAGSAHAHDQVYRRTPGTARLGDRHRSLIFSQVSDPSFWMVQSFFNLDMKQTFATWSVLETILSLAGLCAILLLAAVLQ
jgi:H+/gluconate symporter-like permease